MIEGFIEYCCRNRFLVILVWVGIALAGALVMRRTPIDAIPDLSENQVIVFTDWMGRSPKEIEDQITYPLSVNLQGLAGVKAVRSSSEFNFSMINIIFDDSVEFYFARNRVLERLALASTFLPQGVVPYLAPDATALGQVFWYTVEGDNTDAGTLRAIQDWYVRYQLNSIPGVAQVASIGGFPREYQVDVLPERLRARGVTLGEIYGALQASNAAFGGRVIHKAGAEYIVRGVGWIRSLEDIRESVVAVRGGIPIKVGDVATVQTGSEFRRGVLEKDGREVTGGVVMMRYGENPLDVTRRVKEKIRELHKGLPAGVRIVPFYDRTRLVEGAVHSVSHVLEHEIIIATIAILLILGHVRSVFVVVVTLPLAILFAFILMRFFGISSNIMSLSGIAISIGILVDQAIVMVENATHRLTAQYGEGKITGDTTDIVVGACRQVGRPIFFSVLIMVISFLPVFALSGQEGKLFHPLAFTKTFALIGTALMAVSLVPALIPLLIRGRLAREEKNWIVRSVVEMYRPILRLLMHRPKTVVWLFVILLSGGFYFARHLGREFMPPLDEGSILDMPISVPRMSVTQAADDIKARDAMIRQIPEVEMVVGKVGRADTPTDPAPLDMIETVVNLRPRAHWMKRKLRPEDARAEADRVLAGLESSGTVAFKGDEAARHAFIETAYTAALEAYDREMRREIGARQLAFEETLAEDSIAWIVDALSARITAHHGWSEVPNDAERQAWLKGLIERHKARFMRPPETADVERVIQESLAEWRSRLDPKLSDPLAPVPGRWDAWTRPLLDSLSLGKKDFVESAHVGLLEHRFERWTAWGAQTNRALFDVAMLAYEKALLAHMESAAREAGRWNEASAAEPLNPESRAREFADRAFLWSKTKAEIVREMDGEVRQLGWANIWTQPIINRVDMLATGVRTQIGVKVFGRTLEQIQQVSNELSAILKRIPGAVDVVADQSIGKGYVEIEINRARAARYGVSVAQLQEIVEVALGGKPITMTVEGRERFPIRLRYARDFREDEEAIKRILVTAQSSAAGPSMTSTGGAGGMSDGKPEASKEGGTSAQVHLADVADVRLVEGPVMIKSENGMLRSYVQLNVRDRDIVGFVEEAQRKAASGLNLPEGSFLEWTGQFEHQVRARNTLRIVFPAVLAIIFLILYLTYHDLMHALLMMMAVPGALAGGVMFQWLFGYNFSVAVWVGFIACFGMATETGIIMLVYLRDAIAERGGLAGIPTLEALEEAVVSGAVHRLRPKLLTEGVAIVGLAPMLWAKGVGAEVMAPMAAPVLGGLLVADEVIDIFLPVLFYHVEARRWRKLHAPPDHLETQEEARS